MHLIIWKYKTALILQNFGVSEKKMAKAFLHQKVQLSLS